MAEVFGIQNMASTKLNFLCKPAGTYDNRMLDSVKLERCLPLDSCCGRLPPRSGSMGIGVLVKLSTEVLFETFANMDIETLFRLRQTSYTMRSNLEAWPVFRRIMKYGLPAVRGLLATHLAHLWTAPQLDVLLFTESCEICGAHGEVVQLLKLMRCCSGCLANERALLAIPHTYLHDVMCVSNQDIHKIPQAGFIGQGNFWGAPVSDYGIAYDYLEAVKFARKPVLCQWPQRNLVYDCVARVLSPKYLETTKTRYPVKDDFLHICLRPSSTPCPPGTSRCPRQRRQVPLWLRRSNMWTFPPRDEFNNLHLHECLFYPPESSRTQFRISVHLPALVKNPDHTIADFTIVKGFNCTGCAYFYNYHSTQPFQTHRLYAKYGDGRNSPIHQHLSQCIYARLYWHKLHPIPHVSPAPDLARTIQILTHHGSVGFHFPRHNYVDYDGNLALFELIPGSVLGFLAHHAFDQELCLPQRRLKWTPVPSGIEQANNAIKHSMLVFPKDDELVKDTYGDMLIQPEAASQASWACSHRNRSDSRAAFVDLMMAKKARWNMKLNKAGKKVTAQWGFENLC